MSFVLVPGAGGAGWYWHLVVAELHARGHDAVAVDLPADDQSAGLKQYADAIVEAAAGRGDITLVAQSMGAFSAPLVCDRLPVSLLVLVNPMVPAPGETAGEWWDNTGQGQARTEYAVTLGLPHGGHFDPFIDFLHDVPENVIAESEQHQRDQAGSPFGEPWPLAAWPDVPTRVLVGTEDRFFPFAFQRRVVRDRLGFAPDEMPGGHLMALSRPREVADRLTRYTSMKLARAAE